MENIDLSIIVASYGTADYLEKCLTSIYKNTKNISYEVIVVDDCSPDHSPQMVREKFPQAKLIENEKNLRYTETNNKGLDACQGRFGLLLNSDVEVHEGAFEKLVTFMDQNKDVAAAGPKLINPDGSVQHCIRSFPGLMVMVLQTLNFHKIFPGNRFTDKYYNTDFDYNLTQPIDSIGTTAFIIRRSIWENIGKLDPKFTHHFVDLSYCLMLKQKSEKVFYVHDAVVTHYGSISINMNGKKEISRVHDALRLFYDEYYADNHSFIYNFIVRQGIKLRAFVKLIEFKLSKNGEVLGGVGISGKKS
ncbi:MAG: glycosyltransferase family 2 protein [Halobacteriovoraceae bacterium]|jgi:GT2 family glycosyltransferase|nr:glycosyltransferase family 2 protein [Halobacteriovoraceae bacterium]